MTFRNKYVIAKNQQGAAVVGIIPRGGFHQDWNVPDGFRVVSAGWFTDRNSKVETFGESYGYRLSPEFGDEELISQHIAGLSEDKIFRLI